MPATKGLLAANTMKARDRQNPQSISARCRRRVGIARRRTRIAGGRSQADPFSDAVEGSAKLAGTRSEEHTSELQSLMRHLVCRLLLEKNNTSKTRNH